MEVIKYSARIRGGEIEETRLSIPPEMEDPVSAKKRIDEALLSSRGLLEHFKRKNLEDTFVVCSDDIEGVFRIISLTNGSLLRTQPN